MLCAYYSAVSNFSCGLWGQCPCPDNIVALQKPLSCTTSGLQGDGDQICFGFNQSFNGPQGVSTLQKRLLGHQEHEVLSFLTVFLLKG